ncbi:hypothetical protein [Streptomyces sp. CT34]|uniref:hypothetical protein n=1 Tax=Streptomyces sp. CT34 TaxID=1553907 RepID=UPI0005B967BB|nr:hypothetical protein [Streptomyces sp. CT34]
MRVKGIFRVSDPHLDSTPRESARLSVDHDEKHIHYVCDGVDDDTGFISWWLTWDGSECEIISGKLCTDGEDDGCLLPDGHQDGLGCKEPKPPHCPSSIRLTAAEVSRFDALPHAVHQVESERDCGLALDHQGLHGALVQGQDLRHGEESVERWATWDDPGSYEIAIAAVCPAEPDGDECLLFAGHRGEHDFG